MNSIMVIAPYRHLGMWVFDDERVGLVQEPFVGGADTLIDLAVQHIPNAQKGFRLVFSANPFPGHNLKLSWVEGRDVGQHLLFGGAPNGRLVVPGASEVL